MNNTFLLKKTNQEIGIPAIFCLALYQEAKGEVQQQLLPDDRKSVDKLMDTYQREGTVHVFIDTETDHVSIIEKIKGIFGKPLAAKAILIVFGQNGYVLERFMKDLKEAEGVKITHPAIGLNNG